MGIAFTAVLNMEIDRHRDSYRARNTHGTLLVDSESQRAFFYIFLILLFILERQLQDYQFNAIFHQVPVHFNIVSISIYIVHRKIVNTEKSTYLFDTYDSYSKIIQ